MSRARTLSGTEIKQDTPIRLSVAAELRGLTAGSLRTEAKRGRLTIWRVAGKDWTSLAEIDRMFARCRVQAREPDFGSDRLDEMNQAPSPNPLSGSSKTEKINAALDAARATVQRLKQS